MEKVNYKVKIPLEIIERGNKFIEAHPGIKIEDYLRAQVVLYSTRPLDNLDRDLDQDESFGKEMLFSLNSNLEKSLKRILEEQCIGVGHIIRNACMQIDKELILGSEEILRSMNLILKSM